MKIGTSKKIELAASTDSRRRVLQNIYYDKEKAKVIATDGSKMAVLSVTVDEGDTSGYIQPEVFTENRKSFKNGKNMEILPNGSIKVPANGVTKEYTRPDIAYLGNYPTWENVVPTYEKSFKVGLNPSFLLDLAKALGSPEKVTLEFKEGDNQTAIKVHGPDEDFGVLMPIRID